MDEQQPLAADQTPLEDADRGAELQRLTLALALAERDRQLVGFEIHDGIVQDLSAAAMLLDGAGRQAAFESPAAEQNFATGLRLLRESIAAARRLIRGLATVELDDSGLVSALARLALKFRTDHGLPVEFEGPADEVTLPASVQHLLLRIAQEALYNAWKHAAASHVTVRLAPSAAGLKLTIADDGRGFDPAQIPSGHYGLEGMRARARLLGSELEVTAQPGAGTQVAVLAAGSEIMR